MHQHLQKSDFSGVLKCARYAFMPNKLNYCGGDSHREILAYVSASQADFHLESLLSDFATLYPYLKFIANSNKIIDSFDKRVVESYWLGNDLLQGISMNNLREYFLEGLNLKKKFNSRLLAKVIGSIPKGAVPHHNFHVFNLPKRTGHYPVQPTLETMDKCRISWGRVLKIDGAFLEVATQPLELKKNNLLLGESVTKKVNYKLNGKSFVKEPKIGDWVSIHWDWVCDRLSSEQILNLRKYTRISMQMFAN